VEIPSDWSLADSAHFLFVAPQMTSLSDPRAVEAMWQEDFTGVYKDGGSLVLTMHPQIIGRYHRLRMLERLIRHMLGCPGAWFAQMGELNAAFRAAEAQ
jgi:hypothetical protein